MIVYLMLEAIQRYFNSRHQLWSEPTMLINLIGYPNKAKVEGIGLGKLGYVELMIQYSSFVLML